MRQILISVWILGVSISLWAQDATPPPVGVVTVIHEPADVRLGMQRDIVFKALQGCCQGAVDNTPLYDIVDAKDALGQSWSIVFNKNFVAQIHHGLSMRSPPSASGLIDIISTDLTLNCPSKTFTTASGRASEFLTALILQLHRVPIANEQAWTSSIDLSCITHEVSIQTYASGTLDVNFADATPDSTGPYGNFPTLVPPAKKKHWWHWW